MYVAVLNASSQRDFGMPKCGAGALGTGEHPNFHSDTPLDAGWCGTGGAAWSIALADVAQLAHR